MEKINHDGQHDSAVLDMSISRAIDDAYGHIRIGLQKSQCRDCLYRGVVGGLLLHYWLNGRSSMPLTEAVEEINSFMNGLLDAATYSGAIIGRSLGGRNGGTLDMTAPDVARKLEVAVKGLMRANHTIVEVYEHLENGRVKDGREKAGELVDETKQALKTLYP